MKGLSTSMKGDARAGLIAALIAGLALASPAPGQLCPTNPPPRNDCCVAAPDPPQLGCDNSECCELVCAKDPFCCETNWDGTCAARAQDLCICPPPECNPDAGPCDVPHASPGCNDIACCAMVCACDPFCCDVTWDAFCVGPNGSQPGCSYIDLCLPPCDLEGPCVTAPCPGDTNGDGQINVLDLSNVITSWDTNGQGAGFDADLNDDGVVDVQDLTAVITNWGSCGGQPAGGSTQEGEACGANLNGGCNSTPAAFATATCGTTICGTAWADGGSRDTDWYLIDATAACNRITAALVSEFTGSVLVIDMSNCTVPVVLGDEGSAAACAVVTPAEALVEAGTYVVFVAPTAFDANPCGGANAYQLDIQCQALLPEECECELVCPPGGGQEGEACGANLNGGCNSTPPAFGTIACPGTMCGTAWADNGVRDTDWYELVIAQSTDVTATLNSEFPGVVFLVGGIATCTPNVIESGDADFCMSGSPALATLAPGTYVVFVATGDFSGVPCGGPIGNDYVVSTCDSCQIDCGGSPEGEPCGADSNGGCNSTPPAFGAVLHGETICGTAWASGGTRDTDWYQITVGATTITGTLTSEFPGDVFIVDGVAGCVPAIIGTPGNAAGCLAGTPASAPVVPGTYVVFVATDGYDGVPCGGAVGNDYELVVTAP